jgi:phosphate transport system protein
MVELKNRQTLDRQIRRLFDDILILGSMVEQAVVQAVAAMAKGDLAASKRIYAGDVRINERRFQIEEDCLALIATQQPIARDLRVLASMLEVNTELERMGDYAKGIARITLELNLFKPVAFPPQLTRMASICVEMLNRALTAFVDCDEEAAAAIPGMDDEVDKIYTEVYRSLIPVVGADEELIDPVNHLIWASHNLERMADRVTNICERTIFITTAKLIELGR